jgi:hypothetical protein
MHSVHEARQRRHHSPANQNSGDPHPRPDLVQQQIAGYFEKKYPKKKIPKISPYC